MSSDYMLLPGLIFCSLFCVGVFMICFAQGSRDEGIGAALAENSKAELLLMESGLGITAKSYFRGLTGLCLFTALYSLIKAVIAGNAGIFLLGLLGSAYLFFIFKPGLYIFGNVKSLFSILLELLASANRRKMDRGLYSSCVVLKNLAIVWERAPLSADKMLEKLAECAVPALKPVYHTLLAMYRTGKQQEAFSVFAQTIGTPTGRVFAGLLSKLDKINPAELREQAQALIDAISEKRITEGYIQAQNSGAVTMTLAAVSITIAMLDFLVVVVYMDLIAMLTTLW